MLGKRAADSSRFIVAVALVILCGPGQAADNRKFNIVGQLRLPEGMRRLPGAVVVILQDEEHRVGRSTYAERTGQFRFKRVPQGLYQVHTMFRSGWYARISVDVSPGLADAKGNIACELSVTRRSSLETQGRATVSVDQARARGGVTSKSWDFWRQAMQQELDGRIDKAKELLEKALVESPNYADALNMLGTIYHREGGYARSVELFRRALTVNPYFFEPLVNVAGSLLLAGKAEEAERENRRALELRPEDALANTQMGVILLQLGQSARAVPFLRQAHQSDPSAATRPQLYLAQALLQAGRNAEAADALKDYIQRHPDSPEVPQIRVRIARLLSATP